MNFGMLIPNNTFDFNLREALGNKILVRGRVVRTKVLVCVVCPYEGWRESIGVC